jgi:hypothetical protein
MRWLRQVLMRVLQGLAHAYGLLCFGLVVVLLEFGNLSAQRRRDLAFLLQLADEGAELDGQPDSHRDVAPAATVQPSAAPSIEITPSVPPPPSAPPPLPSRRPGCPGGNRPH